MPATEQEIKNAADALRKGQLVVMPTETVYGLAANALDPAAVRRIFEVKGRPSENPLIVHVASAKGVLAVVSAWPEQASLLAKRFWPGALTLVLPKRDGVADEVTAGLPTVAVRVPNHPVALALLERAGVPLAAPSANRFTALSPTRPEDVDALIREAVFAVLDGGPCQIGIESTIVDLSGKAPRLLRPGGVPRAELEELIGPLQEPEAGERPIAPGMYPRHYAPKTPARFSDRLSSEDAGLTFEEPTNPRQIRMPGDPAGYAARLYAELQRLDRMGVSEIVIQWPPDNACWEAVINRLSKSAHA